MPRTRSYVEVHRETQNWGSKRTFRQGHRSTKKQDIHEQWLGCGWYALCSIPLTQFNKLSSKSPNC